MSKAKPPLRRGWTTGACAAAAARAAWQALLTGVFPEQVSILLPGGQRPCFALAMEDLGRDFARAGIVKDAGDDPDVTHGALIVARVTLGEPGGGIVYKAGEGVGVVTRPGLPLRVGEPAINPAPRKMIKEAIEDVAKAYGAPADAVVEISIPGGEAIAERTLNGRLGIVGGLSILGTTGIVIPYSCAAWIASIHRGIDVARGIGLTHIAGSTGSTSEAAVKALYDLPDAALIEMGDFVGGMLKYLRRRPVQKITVAGGMAKMTKLAQGMLDLHSKRGAVDMEVLARFAPAETARLIARAQTVKHAFDIAAAAQIDLAGPVAQAAWSAAAAALDGAACELEVVIFDRDGRLLARSGFKKPH